jgi:molecular chaperone DnaK
MAADNRSLGQFNLTGIAPAPRGMPQIEVTFDIDANGIISVSAKDKATNKEQSIKIEGSSGLSDAEIEKMKQDAKEHAADDLKKKELVDARNQAEGMCFQMENQLKEHGDKVPADLRGKVESAISQLKETAKGDDADAIKKATENLMQEAQEIGKIVYEEMAKQQQAAGAAGGGGPGASPGGPDDAGGGDPKAQDDENVIDADFTVKDAK